MLSRSALTALSVIHLLVAIWHGMAHSVLAVGLSPAQRLFVYAVVVFAPVVAAALLWTRYSRFAIRAFLAVMFASLLFGLYYH